MKKLNNKSIFLGLKTLSILTFSVLFIPAIASADIAGYVTPYSPTGYSNPALNNPNYGNGNGYGPVATNNQAPVINSISPKSSNVGVGTKTVTIIGSGFIPSSVARVNGSPRPTTFVNDSTLLVQVNGTDMSNYQTNGGFYITVLNGVGGYSNAVFFTVNKVVAPVVNTNKNTTPDTFTDTSTTNATNSTTNTTTDNYSNLTSNAVYGSNNGFLPSGLIQWILLAIIILIIVILARKVFGGKEAYEATPLKHA